MARFSGSRNLRIWRTLSKLGALPLCLASANTYAGSSAHALVLFAFYGHNAETEKFMLEYVLCVRGGSGVDPQ
jgi:hypothetical protein